MFFSTFLALLLSSALLFTAPLIAVHLLSICILQYHRTDDCLLVVHVDCVQKYNNNMMNWIKGLLVNKYQIYIHTITRSHGALHIKYLKLYLLLLAVSHRCYSNA